MDLSDVAPDEVALAGEEHLDPGYVATYDEGRGSIPRRKSLRRPAVHAAYICTGA